MVLLKIFYFKSATFGIFIYHCILPGKCHHKSNESSAKDAIKVFVYVQICVTQLTPHVIVQLHVHMLLHSCVHMNM